MSKEEIARQAARDYYLYEDREHNVFLGSEDKLTEIILVAIELVLEKVRLYTLG